MNLKFYCYCSPADIEQMVTFLNGGLNMNVVTHEDKFASHYVRFQDTNTVAVGMKRHEYKEESFDRYHFRSDRKILLYKLKEHYGNELKIDDNLSIQLSDKQVQLLNKAYGYYQAYGFPETAALIKETLRAKHYPYHLTDELNEISSEYKNSESAKGLPTYDQLYSSNSYVEQFEKNKKDVNDVFSVPKDFMTYNKNKPNFDAEYIMGIDPAKGDDVSVTRTYHKPSSKKVWVDKNAELSKKIMTDETFTKVAKEVAEEADKNWMDRMTEVIKSDWFK